MRFSKLRLSGFKSFVDPTELVISEGLTGVVGPNGCGKSNLLEALRWVMGENRPTAMRGGGMEDVIFAGAASRTARNYAEVSLLIDNSQRLAPVAFNQEDKLEVIRRITRDVGSAYKANGKDTRARDVQMLFADASTGAHSPSLVRQGQISELINAKPKARRRILEEAAGISGLYQRRHEAELKLKAAETNLTRVDDVIEQLDGQLKTLERQAKQAKRYREIGEELRNAEGLLLYRRWKEAEQAQSDAQGELTEATQGAAQAQGLANKANQARNKAEDMLPPLREELAIASAALQRLLVSRDGLDDQERRAKEQLETLQARIEQLGKDIEREIALNADAGETIERLEWEAREIEKAGQGHDAALGAANEAARSAAQVMQDAESELDKLTEDAARLAARHQSAHRLLDEANAVLERRKASADDVVENLRVAMDARIEAQTAVEMSEAKDRDAQSARATSETDLAAAETARAEAQTAEAEARGVLSEAEATSNALGAEVTALERVIARDKTEQDQLIDKLRVEKGFEAALGAALADDLKAPIVTQEGISGWRELADYDAKAGLPAGAEPLSSKVQAPALLNRRLAQVGLVARTDGARLQGALQPGQRLVSKDGDLWRWDGFAQGAEDASSASALRLQQMNRLAELQETRGKAVETMMDAQAKFNAIHSNLESAQAAEADARQGRKRADDEATQATRALSKAKAEAEMRIGQVETLTLAKDRVSAELGDAETATKDAKKAIDELGDVDRARDQVEAKKIGVEAARVTMLTKRSLFDDLRREGEARKKRAQEITQEVSGWKHRQKSAETHIAELKKRKDTSQEELALASAAPEDIAAQRAALANQVTQSEKRMVEADNAVSEAERTLREADSAARDAERKASDCREARARADAVAEAAKAQIEAAAERIMDEMECSPDALLEQLDADPEKMPPSDKIEENVQRLRRQRDALGAVNLRAEEDAAEVTTERDDLSNEKHDLEEAIRELRKGIAGLNKEGRERLLQAFDEVNTNFAMLFKKLFGGGEANLVLVESDDPLEAGLEIMCQPPGKKLATLSLLSGGEQTLTALALIFAVFLANPAPICVLDEVDAPLDDANVNRFCNMLDEMVGQTDTRFLIITHHAVTMARMDRLFGVTMAEQGVSQLVSVDLQSAEEMVDA